MEPGSVVGRYRVIEPIGRGGMGEVWLAEPVGGGERVALKRLRSLGLSPQRSEVLRRRLRREARITLELDHPHIVRGIDSFEHEGDRLLVLQHVAGDTLGNWMATPPLPSLLDRLAVLRQVVTALVYAHGRGVIHRDLTPLNILVADGPWARIIDFGLARGLDSTQLTHTGLVVGTIAYMPPEQGLGREVDERADVFPIGMILAVMLGLSEPLAACSQSEIYRRLIREEPVPIDAWLPDDLRGVLAQLLAKDPERRPRADAALALLDRLIAEGPALGERLARARSQARPVPRLGPIERREAETMLDELRTRVASGRGGGALILGPPGSGCSTALDTACDRLRAAGIPVAHAALVPGAVASEALVGLRRQLGAEDGNRSSAGESLRLDDAALVAEVLELARRRSAAAPVAIAIDDIQGAAASLIPLIDGLVRLASAAPLALLLAGDPALQSAGEGAAAYGDLLLRLAASEHVRRVELESLEEAAVVRNLVAQGVPPEVAVSAQRIAAGRPGVLNQLLAHWHRQGGAPAAILRDAPEPIQRSLALRLETVHATGQRILRALVAAGGEGSLDDILRLAGVPRLAGQARLRELARLHGWVLIDGERVRLTQPYLAAVIG